MTQNRKRNRRRSGAWMSTCGFLLAGIALSLLTGPARGYEQRRNTFSLGIQGGLTRLAGSGVYTRGETMVDYGDYDFGPALRIQIRYSLDRSHAIGFSFEDQRFDRKGASDRSEPGQYQLNSFLAQYYLYFKRRQKVSWYVDLGAGFQRPAFRISDGQNILPGEGFLANLGGGLEYFITRALSIDAAIQGYYLKPHGGSATAGAGFLGIQYYLLN